MPYRVTVARVLMTPWHYVDVLKQKQPHLMSHPGPYFVFFPGGARCRRVVWPKGVKMVWSGQVPPQGLVGIDLLGPDWLD